MGYPWTPGDALLASDLNEAISNASSEAGQAAAVLHATDYGVAPNEADNTTALQAFFAALQAYPGGVKGVLPSGILRFTTPLDALNVKSGFSLVGSGIGATTLLYTGASTTVDLLKLNNCANFSLFGFTIDSQTVMTAGTGLHLENCGHGMLTEIKVGGQSGSTHVGSDSNSHYNLWNGFWFDRVDQITLQNFEAAAQNDGMRVNGNLGALGGKAGLFIQFGKILGSKVGLHVGGAFGGVMVDNTDIIANWNNVVVDQTLAAENNREVFFGVNVSCDSSGTVGTPTSPGPVNPGGGAIGDNVLLNDPGGGFFVVKGWIASSFNGGHCIHVMNWAGVVRVDGAVVAYAFDGKDGIRINTDTPDVIVTPGTNIHGITGWGINKTTGAKPVWGAPVFTAPGSGYLGDTSATTKLQTVVKSLAVSYEPNLSAAGTTQATATLLPAALSVVVAGAAGSGVIAPVLAHGAKVEVINLLASSLLVYPPVGWSVFAGGTNGPRTVPSGYRLALIANAQGSQMMIEFQGPLTFA